MVKRFGAERGKRKSEEVNGFISPCFCGTWKCILGRNISSFHTIEISAQANESSMANCLPGLYYCKASSPFRFLSHLLWETLFFPHDFQNLFCYYFCNTSKITGELIFPTKQQWTDNRRQAVCLQEKAREMVSIAHVQYIKILSWLWGFWVKTANFLSLHSLAIPRRNLSTKNTKTNTEKWPESLGVM